MAGCASKHHARKVDLGEARDTTSKGGDVSQGVSRFLHGGGTGDFIVWVINVGPFCVNVKEDRGEAHRVPANDHGEEIKAIRR